MTNTVLTLLSRDRIEEHYRSGFWRNDTIYSLARGHAARTPDKAAIRDLVGAVGYGDLVAAADRLAHDLAQRGLRPGQRVAVWLPSRVETAVALLACSRNGYVCCPSLHRDHTVAEIVALLERTRAAALLIQPGYGAEGGRRDIAAEVGGLASLRHIYRLAPVDPAAPRDIAGFLAGGAPDAAAPAPTEEPDRVLYLAFTSGTTGQPKGVMHSDNTLLANARAMAADWRIGADSVVYSLSPLSHNLGLGALVMSLAMGSELVVHDLPRGRSLVDRLMETGATFLLGVPTHAIDLLQECRARPDARLRVQGFRISGAPSPKEVVAELLRYGIVPQSGYGMTEACSHQYTLPDDDPGLIVETSGKACPGYEIRIFRQDNPDVEAPIGEVGQIGGRGASLMLGYYDDQTATEDSFNADGWFMTGDLGWVDANGYLRVTGRKKDLIIRGGHNIYPARIEALAMRHDAVERAAALPIADARLGEKVCLAVMLRSGRQMSPAQVLDHLDAAGLSKYDMPEYFLELDEIPLTASGKIRKRDLIEWIQQGRVAPTPVRFQAKS
jgi:acyl-CoA synthetase